MAMGEIFSSLQIIGSLSIFGVLGFISKRLIFQCYFRRKEGKRKREAHLYFPLSQSFRLSCQCMALSSSFLSELLFRKVMPGSVLKTNLGSSRNVKGFCSHSVVGAFHIVVWIHFRPCCVSRCLRKSTFRWKPLPHRSQPKGLKPVCFRLWVMRLEL